VELWSKTYFQYGGRPPFLNFQKLKFLSIGCLGSQNWHRYTDFIKIDYWDIPLLQRRGRYDGRPPYWICDNWICYFTYFTCYFFTLLPKAQEVSDW